MGVEVACLGVNDPFVLKSFLEATGTSCDDMSIIADFEANFSKALDKTIDGSGAGLGIRAGRFSFYANNGVIEQFFEEPVAGELTVADGKTMLDTLEKSSKL